MGNESIKALLNHEKFAEIIKESGMTQEELAEELDISDRYLRTLKSENRNISVALAYGISKQSGCSIESILTVNGCKTCLTDKTEFDQHLQKQLAKGVNLIHSVKNSLQNIFGLLAILDLKCKKQNIKMETVEPIRQELIDITTLMAEYISQTTASDVCKYSLNQLILEITQTRLAQFAAHNVEIKLMLDDNLPDTMLSKQHLKQVFVNCLNNSLAAILAGEQTHGKIFIWTHFDESREMLQIIIADNGSGLNEEQQANFFNPRYTTKKNGNGIGSSISLAVIKQHGGDMSVSNQPEKGCCIRIELPVQSEKKFNDDDLYSEIADMLF